eukprot:scaffold59816_cov57-Phaeocystis_antarctica.AAC.2
METASAIADSRSVLAASPTAAIRALASWVAPASAMRWCSADSSRTAFNAASMPCRFSCSNTMVAAATASSTAL